MHKITLTLRYHTPFQGQHGVQVNHYSTETMSMTETAKSIAPDTLYGNRNTGGRIHVVACCAEFLDGIREIGGDLLMWLGQSVVRRSSGVHEIYIHMGRGYEIAGGTTHQKLR